MNPHTIGRVVLAGALLLAVALPSCNCQEPVSQWRFSCSTLEDCADGYVCRGGECRPDDGSGGGGGGGTACTAGETKSCAVAGCVQPCVDDVFAACAPASGGPFESNPQHCGECGRVCPSGSCVDSRCVCVGDSDCPQGLLCKAGGLCVPPDDPCASVKCPSSQVCRAGSCNLTPCSGGCVAGEVCDPDQGLCKAISACRSPEACDAGICEGAPRADGTPCDDGQACSYPDVCTAGTCNGTPYSCAGSSGCQDNLNCAGDGGCAGTPKLDGTPCDDDAGCTFADQCLAGVCTGTQYSCPASSTCQDDIACLGDGGCLGTATNEGGACDDTVDCTRSDVCTAGNCSGITYSCPTPTPCQQAVACAGDGGCIVTNKNDGDSCDDSVACTSGDVCNAGVCAGTPGTSYRDVDGDGRGDSNITFTGCPAPVGYVSAGGDCNDADPDVFQAIQNLVADGDKDGYSTGTADVQCVGAAVVLSGRTYYADVSGAATWLVASQSLGTDCNDASDFVYRTVAGLVPDLDNDGYNPGAAAAQCVGATSTVNGRSYYRAVTGNYTWLASTSALGSDCLDTNANVYQSVANLVTDADQDGYTVGTAASQCVGPTSSVGGRTYYRNGAGLYPWLAAGSSLGSDCNDTNSGISGPATYYQDSDGDGRGNSSVTQTVCTPPLNYVAVGGDCDDTNILIYQTIASLVLDADQDGRSSGTPASQCVGASSVINTRTYYKHALGGDRWLASSAVIGTDCDDSEPDIYQTVASLVTDADQDGWTIGSAASQCVGATSTSGGRTYYANASGVGTWLASSASLGSDCNDASAAVTGPTTYYLDGDDDGYGGSTTQAACSPPGGLYILTGGDCDDTVGDVYQNVASLMTDADQDGYTIGAAGTRCVGNTSLSGGRTYYKDLFGADSWLGSTASLGTDCDDGDPGVLAAPTWYLDSDGDTYGGSTSQVTCSAPLNYVANTGDCNDVTASGGANVYRNLTVAADIDQDGYYTGTAGTQCVGANVTRNGRTYYMNTGGDDDYWLNAGQALGTSDCSPSNPALFQTVTNVVADDDRDGYPPNNTQSSPCAGATSTVGGRTYYAASASPNDYWMDRTDCIWRSGSNCTSPGFDCYELNSNAHPPPPSPPPPVYFTVHRGDGSFDYDCSGTVTTAQSGTYCTTFSTVTTYSDGTCATSGPTYDVCTGPTGTVAAPTGCGNNLAGASTFYNPGACTAINIRSGTIVSCR